MKPSEQQLNEARRHHTEAIIAQHVHQLFQRLPMLSGVVVSGIGGLGHMAVQYAKAMGLNVVAVDISDAKLHLARKLGASLTLNAREADPGAFVKRLDLQEALAFAGAGKVKATVATEPLENINQIFTRMHAGDIEGRIVIDFQK